MLIVAAGLTGGLWAASMDAALLHALPAWGNALAFVGASLGIAAAVSGTCSIVRQGVAHHRVAARLRRLEVRPGVVLDHVPRAYCAGLWRPRVVITTGALHALSRAELGAVLAHEHAHARRRDALRIMLIRAVADALFFCPGARQLAERSAALAELAADEAADTSALASAMLTFDHVAPERVDRLLGASPRWNIGAATLLSGAIAVVGLAIGIALIAMGTGCADDLLGRRGSCDETFSISALLPVTTGATVLLIARRWTAISTTLRSTLRA